MQDDPIVRLLSFLYAAPTEPRRWNDFLRELAVLCGAGNGTMLAHDIPQQTHRVLAGLGDGIKESAHLYESHYWQFDEWTSRFPKLGFAGRVGLGEDVWPESSFLHSVFYNEFLKEYDLCQLAAMYFPGERGQFEGISLYRGKDEEKFGPQQIALLNTLAPHLKIAFDTRRKLSTLEQRVVDLETALDSVGSSLILLDSKQNAIFVNRKARTLLTRENGLYLQKSKLISKDSRDTSQLQQLIAKAFNNPAHTKEISGGSMSLSRPGRRPFHILVSPVCSDSDPVCRKASVAVFIDDPEEHLMVAEDVLQTLFGLTPAEARLALSVLNGHSVSEAAELRQVSRETVKSQMKAVLAKTGTRRQGEMIRLISRLPAISR